jgi:flagellar hook assembly protein FlgD
MVILSIYDVLGNKIRTLVNEKQTEGFWSINWDGSNSNHQPTDPGIYIYQLQVGDAIQTRKMMLIKSGIY